MKNLLLDNAAAISEVRRTAEALKTGGVSHGYHCSSGQDFF